MPRNFVVVGGGITGLVAALLLAERKVGKVTVVEREPSLGGLLRCFDYGVYGRFDYGMHNMYETGIPELDDLLFGLLPRNDWQILEGRNRDLAGLFFQGKLQRHSPYPDIRSLSEAERDVCFRDLIKQIGSGTPTDESSAYVYAKSRLGAGIADFVIGPAVEKQFRRPAAEMDVMATMITTMNRVVMFDEGPTGDLMKSDLIRDRVAYPEQRNLPVEYASGKKAYYPKQYGMYRVIDALLQRLRTLNVSIFTSTQVKRVVQEDSKVVSMTLISDGTEQEFKDVSTLVWTTGFVGIAPLIGLEIKGLPFDRPLRTVVVSLLISKPLDVGDLYYFYCYDKGYDTFRVTNFGGYCDGAARARGYPISVELLVEGDQATAEMLVEQAVAELRRFGVLAAGTEFIFRKAEPLASGFPMPTVKNIRSIGTLRQRVGGRELKNLIVLGILSEPKLFFQRDVLAHTFSALSCKEFS